MPPAVTLMLCLAGLAVLGRLLGAAGKALGLPNALVQLLESIALG
jgi:hypothetical protein